MSLYGLRKKQYLHTELEICEERAARGPARNYRRYTGLNLNSTAMNVIAHSH